MRTYRETFDDGPGGWHGWISNAAGQKRLEVKESCALSRSPWWIDYNHAPPGAGYMNLLFMILTRGSPGEHLREVAGENRLITGDFGTDFTNAKVTLRLKGELLSRGTRFHLLVQGFHGGVCTGWILTGQSFEVTPDWSEQTVTCVPDEQQWTCLGSRHDRVDFYGQVPLKTVLADVNANILLVLYPLDVAPMGPIDGDPHKLRPEVDYPVWRSKIPEGYVMLDEVRIELAS